MLPAALGPCSPNPCQNGGQCYNLSNSEHYCACDSGFTGDNCEKGKYIDLAQPKRGAPLLLLEFIYFVK